MTALIKSIIFKLKASKIKDMTQLEFGEFYRLYKLRKGVMKK